VASAQGQKPAAPMPNMPGMKMDMGIVTGVGRAAHVPLPLASAAQQLFLIAEAAGLGAHDDSSVVTVLSPHSTEGTVT